MRADRVLRDQWGRQLEDRGLADDGRARPRLSAPTPSTIAQQLAGWGALVELVDPTPVRVELARLGAEPVERYRGS